MALRDYFGEASQDPYLSDPYATVGQGGAMTWDAEDLVRRVNTVTRHLPRMKKAPKLALAMAQIPVADDELVKAIRSSGAWEEARHQRAILSMMPPAQQHRKWAKMGKGQQALLRSTGYQPSALDESFEGGGVLGGLGDVVRGVTDPLGMGIGPFKGGQESLTRGRERIRAGPLGPVVGLRGPLAEMRAGQVEAAGQATAAGSEGYRAVENLGIPGLQQGMRTARIASRDVLGGVGELYQEAATGAGALMHGINVVSSTPAHAYRFLNEYNERVEDPGFEDTLSSWSDIWEETGANMGEGYFPDATHKRVAAIMPGDERAQAWAKSLAAGLSIEEIASQKAKPGTRAYEQRFLNIATRAGDPDFKKALRTLELGKVSPGRDLARGFGLQPGSTPYNYVSGGMDLTFTLTLDPLLVAGKVNKGIRAARWGVPVGQAEWAMAGMRAKESIAIGEALGDAAWTADRLSEIPIGRLIHIAPRHAWADRVAAAFRAGSFTDEAGNLTHDLATLTQAMPGTKRSIDSLIKWDIELRNYRMGVENLMNQTTMTAAQAARTPGIRDADDVWDFMQSTAGFDSLIRGQYGGFTRNYFDLPRLTRRGLVASQVKAITEKTIDFSRGGEWVTRALGPDEVQVLPGQAPITVEGAIGGAGRTRADELYAIYKDLDVEGRVAFTRDLEADDIRLLRSAVGYEVKGLDAPAQGYTRLFRVTHGLAPRPNLPNHIDPYVAEIADIKGVWSDDLAHARAIVDAQGPTSVLHYVDAPAGSFEALADELAAVPGREFRIVDDEVFGRATELGTVGKWVAVDESGALAKTSRTILAPAANMIYAMTHRVPETTTLASFGPNFVTGAERLLDTGFLSPVKRQWMHELLTASSPAARRRIMRSAMDHMFFVNGVYDTPEGVEMAQKFLNGTKQMYAADGLDLMFFGGNPMHVGIGAIADHANGFMIPSFREVIAQSQRASLTRRLFGGINNSMVESFMGTYWKPSVLLRLGFIPRAAGEEMLAAVLRAPEIMTNRFVMRPLALRQGEPLWLTNQLAMAAGHMGHFIGDWTGSHIENFAQYLSNTASEWVRGMAARHIGPEEMRAARAMANSAAMQAAETEPLTRVGAASFIPTTLPNENDFIKVLIRPKTATSEAEYAIVRPGVSDYEQLEKTSQHFPGFLATRVQHYVKDDTPFQAAGRATGAYFGDHQRDEMLTIVRRRIADDDTTVNELIDRLGNPAMTDVAHEARLAINTNPRVRNALWRNHGLRRADPANAEMAKNAGRALNDARSAASTPIEKLAVEIFADADVGLREALLVDENAILRHLGVVADEPGTTLMQALAGVDPPEEGLTRAWVSGPIHPAEMDPQHWNVNQIAWHPDPEDALELPYDGGRATAGWKLYYVDFDEGDYIRKLIERQLVDPEDIPFVTETDFSVLAQRAALSPDEELVTELQQLPGFEVAPDYTPIEAEPIKALLERARDGDVTAAWELSRKSARKELDNLLADSRTARFVRESERSTFNMSGLQAENPIAEGMSRRYLIVANPEGVASMANLESEALKGFVARNLPPGDYARQMADAQAYGLSKYQPVSTWSTASRSEADEMRRLVSQNRNENFAVGYVDVPDARLLRVGDEGLNPVELSAWNAADEAGPTAVPVPDNIEEIRTAYAEHRMALDEYEAQATRFMEQDLDVGEGLGGRVEAADARLAELGFDMGDLADEQRLKDLLAGRKVVDRTSENLDDWAGAVAGLVRQLSSSPVDGRILHEIAPRAARQGSYRTEDVVYSGIEYQHLPDSVPAPQVYAYDPSLPTKIVEKGFGFINKSIAALVREPMYKHNFFARYPLADELMRSSLEDPAASAAMIDLAKTTPGRQRDVLDAYHWTYQQLGEIDSRFHRYAHWADADMEVALRDALEQVKVIGVKPKTLDGVKSHFLSMNGEEVATLRKWSNQEREIERVAHDAAAEGAVADTIPFIDDHKIRSQYSEYMRNLTPFWFAEEQMLKRWARVLVHSPEALRRAQLLYMGVKHAGIVRQNEFGDDVWVMPGSAPMMAMMAKAGEAVFGEQVGIPVAVPFTGSVKYTLPGLNRVGAPAFSPVVSVPMTLLGRRFPELTETNEMVLGEQSATRSIVDQLVPVSLTRVWDAVFSGPDTSAQYTSAMIQAMQYMEANDLTPEPPGPHAGPRAQRRYDHEMDEYIDRVENWTRAMLATRAIFGFVMPAPPQMEMPKNLNPELQELLRNVPYEDAIATFMKRHPNGTAYTVFTTESPSGASMPTTPEVGRFLDENADFVDRHDLAVPWLLPQGDRDDPTSRSVYAKQVKMGLRERKSPEQWIEDFAFAEASEAYFDTRNVYERNRLVVGDDKERRDRLDTLWNDWKAKYLKMHPLFTEQLQSREAHDRRLAVLDDTRAALMEPDRPEIEHADEMLHMVNTYYTFVANMEKMRGDRTRRATEIRQRLRVMFANWGRSYISVHPHLGAYWYRNIEAEIGLTTADTLELEETG